MTNPLPILKEVIAAVARNPQFHTPRGLKIQHVSSTDAIKTSRLRGCKSLNSAPHRMPFSVLFRKFKGFEILYFYSNPVLETLP